MKKKKILKPSQLLMQKKRQANAGSLALRLFNAGRVLEADRESANELKKNPNDVESLYVQGLVAHQRRELLLAGEFLRQALEARSDFAEAHFALGCLRNDSENYAGAVQSFEQALALGMRSPTLYNRMGFAWQSQDRLAEASDCCRKALEIDPGFFMALDNLGIIHDKLGELGKAEICFRRSLQINSRNPIAYHNLSIMCKTLGLVDEYISCCRNYLAYSLNPVYQPDFLLTMHYSAAFSQAEISAETLRWRALHEVGLTNGSRGHANGRERDRRLRVGYLSADFKDHSVVYFIEPVLRCHDREKIEVFCYANVRKVDAVTARLRNLADHWRDIAVLDDLQTAALVREDHIDIMVDLGGHTSDNRLPVFALRPAPVQVTWLGYPNTTGLQSMDYRLTDVVADPPGVDDQFYSETQLRLPEGFLCYQPDTVAPLVGPLPLLEQKKITFGSFNALAKITPKVVELWAEIMSVLPGSRLVLKNWFLAIPEVAARYLRMFEAAGVSGERLEMIEWLPDKQDHFALYGRIDLALDPFPYNGVTTTCEALWMGVPVVTLRGDRHSGRVGASIMRQVGLDELVAESPQAYLNLVVALANDPQRLATLRAGMRRRLQESPLLDDQRFAASLEEVYRGLWTKWCESGF